MKYNSSTGSITICYSIRSQHGILYLLKYPQNEDMKIIVTKFG